MSSSSLVISLVHGGILLEDVGSIHLLRQIKRVFQQLNPPALRKLLQEKSEPCNLVFGYFGGEVFPCISLIYTAYIGQYLHFRHLNFFVTYLPILGCGWRCLCIFLFIFTHGNTLLTPFHICPLSPESGSLEQANIEITWIYPPPVVVSVA